MNDLKAHFKNVSLDDYIENVISKSQLWNASSDFWMLLKYITDIVRSKNVNQDSRPSTSGSGGSNESVDEDRVNKLIHSFMVEFINSVASEFFSLSWLNSDASTEIIVGYEFYMTRTN